jgi:serine/threonine protein kinase/tetratricopeptide (TPR) repeat protein
MASADRLIDVFNEAKTRPTEVERLRFVAETCGDNVDLKQQVLSLLQAHDRAADFLQPSPLFSSTLLITEKPGDRIRHYKLLQKIGEGGCGVVYMAEQEEPVRRRVALKVIKLGMDTRSVIARFEAERQALALMDHPHIAKVLDAGATETGRPYFVMELVHGIKITDYCDQNDLSTEERLKLFTQVCHAIQHAHQKGIIHRDIKPSNILVTLHDGVPAPKVIDFGIAKATNDQRLTDKTIFTAFEQFIGTPAYMSPEQAEMSGLDIDTRSDIYSLGVLLYELLTGKTPLDPEELLRSGMAEMRRKIRENEPPRPSTRLSTMVAADLATIAKHRQADPPRLIHLVHGDLDWIVMKALEKDRMRRYETANGFAMDVQRHLSNEPVAACPPSNLYRFQKLARRNKMAFAAIAAVTIALALGVVVSSWQALRATRAERAQNKIRQLAEANEQKARTQAAKSDQVAQFMQDMLKGVGPSAALGRDTALLREILDRTAARIVQDLKGQPEVEAELRNTIGTVYRELGDYDKAWAMHSQALAIQHKLVGMESPQVATSLHNLARVLREQGKLAEAETAFREALAMRRKLLGNDHPDVAWCLNSLGSLLSINLKDGEPEALLREAIAIRRKVYGNEHPDVATSLDNLAHILNRQGNATEAIAMHYEALAIRKKAFGPTHPELIHSYLNLARALEGQGKLTEAETITREALLLCQKVLGQQHPRLLSIRADLGRLLRAQGKIKEAQLLESKRDPFSGSAVIALQHAVKHLQQQGKLAAAEEVLLELEPLLQAQPGLETSATAAVQLELGHILWQLGTNYSQHGQFNDAERVYDKALQKFQQLQAQYPTNAFYRQEQAFSLRYLSQVMERTRRRAEAEACLRKALDIYAELAKQNPASKLYPQEAAATHGSLAELLSVQNKSDEAEALCRENLATRKKLFGDVHREVDNALGSLVRVLWQRGKLAEAEAVQREELAVERKLSGNEHPFVANSLNQLGALLHDSGKLSEAEVVFRETLSLRGKSLGQDHPAARTALLWLGAALSDQGKQTEAEAVYREALATQKKLLGDDHPDVASALASLTKTLLAEKRFTEAESAARECLGIREHKLPNDWRTFNTRSMLGGSLLGQKKYAEAEPLLLSGYAGMKQQEDKVPVRSKQSMKESLERLAQLYEATDQSQKAAEWKKELAEFGRNESPKQTANPKP